MLGYLARHKHWPERVGSRDNNMLYQDAISRLFSYPWNPDRGTKKIFIGDVGPLRVGLKNDIGWRLAKVECASPRWRDN
jgi:hypothetical protein